MQVGKLLLPHLLQPLVRREVCHRDRGRPDADGRRQRTETCHVEHGTGSPHAVAPLELHPVCVRGPITCHRFMGKYAPLWQLCRPGRVHDDRVVADLDGILTAEHLVGGDPRSHVLQPSRVADTGVSRLAEDHDVS